MMVDSLHIAAVGAYQLARLLAEAISESNLTALKSYVIKENFGSDRRPTVDGWNPRKGYSYD